ncbi:MAG: hypothetical protein PHT47_06655 [Candidatus Cloacimonetes bacterium]|nr:hypothetical protein [Candidatus Cloacimonadota bacterium]MDX9828512.1 hypothetical protein [Spirochaetia bacterium]
MSKISKHRVRGIAIFIVFLALAAAILQFQNRGHKPGTFNFKDSNNEYRDLKFVNKARITFSAPNVSAAQTGISEIINKRAQQRIRRQNEGSFGAYLFTIDRDDVSVVAEELRAFGTVISQVEQVDTSLVNLDYDSEAARLASYEKEQADLDMVRFPSEVQNRRKEQLHGLIQQARSNLEKLSETKDVLLYITLSPAKGSTSFVSILKSGAIMFLTWLGIFTIGTILVYFGVKLLMYILSLMGVKGINVGGAGPYTYGGSYSNYDRYSSQYGYGNKRKVKRVYKDKSSSSQKDGENK